MDAVEFVREQSRMCDSYKQCKGCPLVNEARVATYYGIPAMKVIARMNYLEAEGFTIEEASKIIAQEVREVAS